MNLTWPWRWRQRDRQRGDDSVPAGRVALRATSVPGDNPIRRAEDDVLGRAASARDFAQQVLSLDATEGAVVGVLGPWGAGKTSFINLARAELEQAGVTVLEFNPWMFSGTAQLVESFFVELSAQLRVRPGLAQVGEYLEAYGEAFSGLGWLPVVGPWLERGRLAAKGIGDVLRRRREGISERRRKLVEALAALASPLPVVLDDIDRLTSAEIRDTFRMVRLVARFPNVVYIVAFDRVRVEAALGEEGIPGRDYLEKILQVVHDLPAVPEDVLRRQVLSSIDRALHGIDDPGPFDEHAWPDVFVEVVRPLIRNMRDVRRYAAAIHASIGTFDGKIALVDALALEAVRVFMPDAFRTLQGAVEGLTTTSGMHGSRDEPPHLKAQVEGLVVAGKPHEDVIKAMITRLFPAAGRHIGQSNYGGEWKSQWLKRRRVSHDAVLRFYLERVVGADYRAFLEAERCRDRLADREALDTYLRSLDPDLVLDVIASLEAFEEEFAPEQVVPGTVVLLNLLPDLPERKREMFEFRTATVVTRVVLRLLRALKDPSRIEGAVREALPSVTSLSSRLELIDLVGHREQAGLKLVSKEAATKLEAEWLDNARAATPDDLRSEKDLIQVLLAVQRLSGDAHQGLKVTTSPEFTLAVLKAAQSELMSQTFDSRSVRRAPRLDWEALVMVYGDEATLKERIEQLRFAQVDGAEDVLPLAERYLSGWRPERA